MRMARATTTTTTRTMTGCDAHGGFGFLPWPSFWKVLEAAGLRSSLAFAGFQGRLIVSGSDGIMGGSSVCWGR
jgi:hypothetical protein